MWGHLVGTERETGYRVIWGDLSGRRHLETERSKEMDRIDLAEWSTDGLL